MLWGKRQSDYHGKLWPQIEIIQNMMGDWYKYKYYLRPEFVTSSKKVHQETLKFHNIVFFLENEKSNNRL